jgi:hypothetical protein
LVRYEEFIKPVLAQIHEEHGSHYRLIPDTFGAAPTFFAKALAEYLATNAPDDAIVLLDSRTTEGRDGLGTMQAAAHVVIQGVG